MRRIALGLLTVIPVSLLSAAAEEYTLGMLGIETEAGASAAGARSRSAG